MKYRASGPSCKRSRTSCAAHGGGILACARACPGVGEGARAAAPARARREKSLTGAVAGDDAGAAERGGDGRADGPREVLRTFLRGSGQASAAVRRVAPDRSAGGAGPLGGPGGGGAAGPVAAVRRARWRRCDGPAVASSSAGSTDGGHSGLGHISSGTMGECAAPLARVGLRSARFAHNPRNPIASTNARPRSRPR